MTKRKLKDAIGEFERAAQTLKPTKEKYILRLFVTGTTPRSIQAMAAIRKICEENLRGRYELEIIDVYQQPDLARTEQIIAAPTLIKKLPVPLRRFIGDMSDTERILVGLDLKKKTENAL